MAPSPRSAMLLPLLLALVSLLRCARAQTVINGVQYVTATDSDGESVLVPDNRKPSLYTGDFGDCIGDSSINVTRFDAAYYKDNMTVLFHLAGNTAVVNEALMMYIQVEAYGASQFELIFNPCNANIDSLCPMKAGVPIQANGIIPVAESDVANIPDIAFSIPDFEGQAVLRIFANSTKQVIGCYSAVITNGASFSHPAAVGSILGIFAAIALIASFFTAIYVDEISITRSHYAHSMSVLVVFAVYQHIFFTGALSMNWPSVLVAFWSNYAWAGGMIYSEPMQNSINSFIGANHGNTSQVGAAGTGTDNPGLAGGYDITQIYRRAMPRLWRKDYFTKHSPKLERALAKRALANSSEGYDWYGSPVKPGLPLPGNFSGFAGTLGQENIPASNAFVTGFIWLLILLLLVAASVIAFKWFLEGLEHIKFTKKNRLPYFRTHWLGFTALAVLRTVFIGFFMMMFLTIFQFTWTASAGVIALAAIVFIIFLVGMFAVAGYACFYRIKFGNYVSEPDRINLEKRKLLKFIPWYDFHRASTHQQDEEKVYAGSVPFWRIRPAVSDSPEAVPDSPEAIKSIHDDEEYTKKFGWLASRFRRTRWWFFACWLVYEFIRACIYAGASGHPMTQVFLLLVVEFLAFLFLIVLRPFESQRLNAIVVYLLGFSKVATIALSAAFDVHFNIARIPTTAIGIVIIVIQGILTIVVLIAIVIGAATSWMSVRRHVPDPTFRPRKWATRREKFFTHVEFKARDVPAPPPPPRLPTPPPEEPKDPYFNVGSVRRMAKIEDEDPEFLADIGDPRAAEMELYPYPYTPYAPTGNDTDDDKGRDKGKQRRSLADDGYGSDAPTPTASPAPAGSRRSRNRSRAVSGASQMSYTSLPRAARVHRASWSAHDFGDWSQSEERVGEGRRWTGASGAGLLSPGATPGVTPGGSVRGSWVDVSSAGRGERMSGERERERDRPRFSRRITEGLEVEGLEGEGEGAGPGPVQQEGAVER